MKLEFKPQKAERHYEQVEDVRFVTYFRPIKSYFCLMSQLRNILTGHCPRCGQGRVFESPNPYNFKKMLTTNKECSHCHLNFIPEIGFYWGATYVSYALTVAFSVFTFCVSTVIFGFMNSLNLTYVAINGALLIVLSPVFFRFSRMLWLWMLYPRDES